MIIFIRETSAAAFKDQVICIQARFVERINNDNTEKRTTRSDNATPISRRNRMMSQGTTITTTGIEFT